MARVFRTCKVVILFQFNSRDLRHFAAAQSAASNSNFRIHVGCVVVYKGNVIAKGWSSERTDPLQARFNFYKHIEDCNSVIHKQHAEIMALKKIRFLDIDMSKVDVYVWRGYKDGSPAMARPCAACMQMIRTMGIKNVYYSSNGGLAAERLIG